jgi:LPXTG-site transpeptidase (sortase) family protein
MRIKYSFWNKNNNVIENRKYISLVANTLIFCGLLIVFLSYFSVFWSDISYRYDKWRGVSYVLEDKSSESTKFSTEKITSPQKELVIKKNKAIPISPINTDFSLVIESLNINAPIIRDVSVINEERYMEALKLGIAHASFSNYPSDKDAQVYLFAHSAINFWQLGPYASVFNQIHRLQSNDKINIFYEGNRYVYNVDSVTYTNNFKIDETLYNTIGPTLILQTCYPPGTTQYRLIVTSSLQEVREYN